MTNELRVMPDFGCFPLWVDHPNGGVDNPPAANLVSTALAQKLDAWAARYDASYDAEYPPDSAFPSPEEEKRFVSDGYALAREAADEVGTRYSAVRYFNISTSDYVRVPPNH